MTKSPVFLFLDSSDLDALVTLRPNVLVYGDRAATEVFLSSLPSRFVAEIREVGIAAFTPGSPAAARTAILHDVTECTTAEQQMLLTWLEHRSRDFQLITTADRSLLDLVDRGEFDARLFYRLNMMSIDLNGHSAR